MTEPIRLPINEVSYRNSDEEALEALGDVLIDGVIDTIPDPNKPGSLSKVSRKRPGLGEAELDLGTGEPVDGIYWWNGRKMVVAISDGKVFKITKTGDTLTATELTGETLIAGNRATFAELGSTLTEFKLTIASRERIHYTNDAVVLQTVTDPDSPSTASYIAFLDNYILANKIGTGEFAWSAIGDHTDWSSLDFANAQAMPDDLIALLVSYREIYLLGEATTEVWYNDGVTPFSRVTLIQYGTLAEYSPCFDGGDLYFLSNEKKVMRLVNGRSPQVLSEAYDKYIQRTITAPADMFAYILRVEGKKWYVANFETDNITLVYDINENAWYEWGKYQTGEKEQKLYNRFLGNCYAYCPNWGMNLIGSRIDGKIYNMSFDNYTDDGDLIRFVKRTGKISHGTNLTKKSKELLWTATCGVGKSDGSESFFGFKFRDNGRKAWSNERQVSLGARGDYKNRRKYSRLGMYETRQYEIVHTDKAPFTLLGAEELVDIVGR